MVNRAPPLRHDALQGSAGDRPRELSGQSHVKRPRQRIALTHQGWYYVALVALAVFGALFRELNLLMLLSGMLAGPLIVNGLWALGRLQRLGVARVLPEWVCAGDRFSVELAITNPRRGAFYGLVVEDSARADLSDGPNRPPTRMDSAHGTLRGKPSAGDEVGGHPTRVAAAIPCIAGQATLRVAYQACLHRRGRYRFGPLGISSHFPLGLVRRSLQLAQEATLVVYPRLGMLARGLLRLDQEHDRGDARQRQRQGSLDGEFYGLRGWRGSDGRRKIHWRSSARVGELMARQFERQSKHELTIIVDPWLPPVPTQAARDNVELAMSCAATIVADAVRHGGCEIALVVAGPRGTRRQGAASPGLLREALEALALADAYSGAEPCDLAAAMPRRSTGSTVVLVTTRPQAARTLAADPGGRRVVLAVDSPDFARQFWLEDGA